MRTTTTFANAKNSVLTASANYRDEAIPMSSIEFESLEKMHIRGEEYEVLPSAQRLFGIRHNISMSYINRLPKDLQADNLNYWKEQEINGKMFFRFNGNQVRGIFTERYKPMDNVTVLEKLSPKIKPETPVELSFDNDLMMLNLLSNENSKFSVNGSEDEFQNGLSIVNSEVGFSSLQFLSYVMRLVCTNGMISRSLETQSRFRHINDNVLEDFETLYNSIQDRAVVENEKWKISQNSHVSNPESTIETFNRRFQLDKDEREASFWGFQHEPGDKMFHIINGYTKASQSPRIDAKQAFKLQETGGKILALLN